MRHCTFTAERHNLRRHARKQSKDYSEAGSIDASVNLPSIRDNTWVATPDPPLSGENPVSTRVDNSLSNTVLKTAISNGTDAMNLLFQAAQHEESSVANAREVEATDTASGCAIVSPTSTALSTGSDTLPQLSSELQTTWNAYRFVRMGWLSAEETVWLVDM